MNFLAHWLSGEVNNKTPSTKRKRTRVKNKNSNTDDKPRNTDEEGEATGLGVGPEKRKENTKKREKECEEEKGTRVYTYLPSTTTIDSYRHKYKNKQRQKKNSNVMLDESDIDTLLKIKVRKIEDEESVGVCDEIDVDSRDLKTNGIKIGNEPTFKVTPVTEFRRLDESTVPADKLNPVHTNPIVTSTQSTLTKAERQIEQFNNLFSTNTKDLTGEYFYRGPATVYVSQEDSKKDQQIRDDFVEKMQRRNKNNTDYGKQIEDKRALKNTSMKEFSNIKYKNDENIWELSSLVSGDTNLLDKERIIIDALIEGQSQVLKRLKNGKKSLRNKFDIPTLPPSYFCDFMRPARGLPFSERPCSRDQRCIVYLRQLKIINSSSKDRAWIAREFLLPSDLEEIESDANYLKTKPRKLCIYCNRSKTEEIYLRMKTKPRSMDLGEMEESVYYKIDKDDIDEGILVIQDHIVKVAQENKVGIDAYPTDCNLLQSDPVNGLIGPFKPLDWSEYQFVMVEMAIDNQGTLGKVPFLRESYFF
jgi:hypothetical protein